MSWYSLPAEMVDGLVVTGGFLTQNVERHPEKEREMSLNHYLYRLRREERGITGLETAIILIAFVMVASVFAYVVLSAGMFSSQKAKEAIHAGLEEVSSTMELKGDVIARSENGTVTKIYFTVGLHPKGQPIDFTDTTDGNNKVIISYHDSYQQFPALDWTTTILTSPPTSDNTVSYVLGDLSLFQIEVDVTPVSANASAAARLGAYRSFTLEVKPPMGPILNIERTIPARTDAIMNLR